MTHARCVGPGWSGAVSGWAGRNLNPSVRRKRCCTSRRTGFGLEPSRAMTHGVPVSGSSGYVGGLRSD